MPSSHTPADDLRLAVNRVKLGTPEHKAALAADELWSAELQKTFGKRAGDARYRPEGRGEPGTPLRAAYEARTAATITWHNA